jgi:hypothetical protein
MASIKLDRKSRRVVFEIKQMPKKTRRAMRNALYLSGKLLRKSASDAILKKKSGRVYRYKGRRIKASQDGESWANRSGTARRGLSFRVQGQSRLYFENSVDYVQYLEDPKSLNRPAMWLAIESNVGKIERYIEQEIDRMLGV